MEKKIIKLASELIKFQSTAEKRDEIKAITDFVGSYFRKHKVFIKRHKKNDKHSIIITFENTKYPSIFLNGHLDVVNASSEKFVPKIKSGKLFARGSADMKGPAAVMMLVMEHFSKQEKKPSLGLMFTTDEEEGGENGAKYLLEEERYSCKLAIIPDGGENMSSIVNKAKGVLHLKIIARGKSAHGSMAWLGDNALDKLIVGYAKTKKMFPKPRAGNLWKPTLNLGAIKGGDAPNKVPDCAEMLLDIRITEKENMTGILGKVKKAFQGCQVEELNSGAVFCVSEKNSYLKGYSRTIQNFSRKKAKFIYEHGALDARHFANKKIPAIIHQPDCGNLHADNEWIDIKSLVDYYEILVKYISEVD